MIDHIPHPELRDRMIIFRGRSASIFLLQVNVHIAKKHVMIFQSASMIIDGQCPSMGMTCWPTITGKLESLS